MGHPNETARDQGRDEDLINDTRIAEIKEALENYDPLIWNIDTKFVAAGDRVKVYWGYIVRSEEHDGLELHFDAGTEVGFIFAVGQALGHLNFVSADFVKRADTKEERS